MVPCYWNFQTSLAVKKVHYLKEYIRNHVRFENFLKCVYIIICIYFCIFIYIYIYLFLFIYIYIYLYIFIYIYIYIYIYLYINLHANISSALFLIGMIVDG